MPPRPRSFFRWREIPGSVWALGLVSMFMDVSSEMIHALLPLYLVGVLGVSALTVGIIEGIAEATASITKIFSGALSDYLGHRKWVAAAGYGLAAITKPVFPLATGIVTITAARFVDRVGKGIRGAPRDARAARRHRIHGVAGRRFQNGVLDRRRAGFRLGRDHRLRRSRA